ncbi:unnamed protein product [Nezara viridula]|uniref:Uncharacterized protein n=1 Tax=Nezara viridula TaxID=85310 RepID=A0A9P0EE99_NEZVI|nr:unnamed protein product [Nezara viridula]
MATFHRARLSVDNSFRRLALTSPSLAPIDAIIWKVDDRSFLEKASYWTILYGELPGIWCFLPLPLPRGNGLGVDIIGSMSDRKRSSGLYFSVESSSHQLKFLDSRSVALKQLSLERDPYRPRSRQQIITGQIKRRSEGAGNICSVAAEVTAPHLADDRAH